MNQGSLSLRKPQAGVGMGIRGPYPGALSQLGVNRAPRVEVITKAEALARHLTWTDLGDLASSTSSPLLRTSSPPSPPHSGRVSEQAERLRNGSKQWVR